MSILCKFENLMPYTTRRQVTELLVLSKMDYADAIYRPLPLQLLKRLQKVQDAAASSVLGRYAKEKGVLKISWLPMKEHRDWHLLKLAFSYINDQQKPGYIDLLLKNSARSLRSSCAPLIESSIASNTFKNDAAKFFFKIQEFVAKNITLYELEQNNAF